MVWVCYQTVPGFGDVHTSLSTLLSFFTHSLTTQACTHFSDKKFLVLSCDTTWVVKLFLTSAKLLPLRARCSRPSHLWNHQQRRTSFTLFPFPFLLLMSFWNDCYCSLLFLRDHDCCSWDSDFPRGIMVVPVEVMWVHFHLLLMCHWNSCYYYNYLMTISSIRNLSHININYFLTVCSMRADRLPLTRVPGISSNELFIVGTLFWWCYTSSSKMFLCGQ